MHVPAVPVDHPDVQRIQPTWHCLLRFRQRGFRPVGAADAAEALHAALLEARVDRLPPPWAAGQEADFWAVSGALAFPLTRGEPGTYVAVTCLTR
jgi:hypothetical protein